MKRIVLFILIATGCISANAQTTSISPCSPYVVHVYDVITAEQSFYTLRFEFLDTIGGSAIKWIQIDGSKNWIHITIKAKNDKCILEGAKIHFLFTDSTRINFPNQLLSNCYGGAEVAIDLLHNNIDLLHLLSAKSIRAIRVMNNYPYSERYFTEKESSDLLLTIQCLLKNPENPDPR